MTKRYIMLLALFAVTQSVAASEIDGHWIREIQAGNEVIQMTLTIAENSFQLTIDSGNKWQSGALETNSPETLKLIVEDFEPKVHLGEQLPTPPNRNFKVLAHDQSTLRLLDQDCLTWMDEGNCTLTWEKQ